MKKNRIQLQQPTKQNKKINKQKKNKLKKKTTCGNKKPRWVMLTSLSVMQSEASKQEVRIHSDSKPSCRKDAVWKTLGADLPC